MAATRNEPGIHTSIELVHHLSEKNKFCTVLLQTQGKSLLLCQNEYHNQRKTSVYTLHNTWTKKDSSSVIRHGVPASATAAAKALKVAENSSNS